MTNPKKPGQKKPPKVAPKPPTPAEKLDAIGIESIATQIADCVFYQDIADRAGVSRGYLMSWLNANHGEAYTRAREARADKMAEDIIDISDNGAGVPLMVDNVPLLLDGKPVMVVSSAGVQHAKLRTDSRKWLASKMFPKQYGDRLELDGKLEVNTATAILAARKRVEKPKDSS